MDGEKLRAMSHTLIGRWAALRCTWLILCPQMVGSYREIQSWVPVRLQRERRTVKMYLFLFEYACWSLGDATYLVLQVHQDFLVLSFWIDIWWGRSPCSGLLVDLQKHPWLKETEKTKDGGALSQSFVSSRGFQKLHAGSLIIPLVRCIMIVISVTAHSHTILWAGKNLDDTGRHTNHNKKP